VVDLAATLAADAGMPDLAVDILESGIRHDPYDESRYLQLADLHDGAGHAAAARVLRERAAHVYEGLH
jgi:Tfp pilus assembly protein PilF